jgi:hypothetical protein
MEAKPCITCLRQLSLEAFPRDSRCRNGRSGECKGCVADRLRAWRANNPDKYRAQYPLKGRRTKTAEAKRQTRLAYENSRREELRAYHRELAKRPDQSAKKSEQTAWRRARLKAATPVWADRNAIRTIYREAKEADATTGEKHHVDHIVPLVSEIVCGLHVPANLRVLHYIDNHKKSNVVWPDMP